MAIDARSAYSGSLNRPSSTLIYFLHFVTVLFSEPTANVALTDTDTTERR